jgi:hypothetical protein
MYYLFTKSVIVRSAATKQSGKSCISGLLRRYAPRNDDGAENSLPTFHPYYYICLPF